jgi:hypothetical protein
MSSRKSANPSYIPNVSSKLRIQSAKRKLSSNGRQSSRPRSRRGLSAPGVIRSAKTNNRNVLEHFNPANFEKIQMRYGEKPKSPDCSKLNETIQTKESEIKDLKRKLILEKYRCAVEMGEKVGEKVLEITSRKRNEKSSNLNGSGGGTRRHKNNSKNSKRRTQNKKR